MFKPVEVTIMTMSRGGNGGEGDGEVERIGSSHSKEQSQSNGLGERRKVGGEARLDTCDDTPSRFSDV